tara:strand:+ start:147 stop:1604 length:1458 start_codon:yes stop_codon:yes gene_type:complete
MKKIKILFILLILILGCSEKKDKSSKIKEEPKKSIIRNEVYISLNDFSEPLSLNVKNDKNQMKPDLITISNKTNSNDIIIPTDNIVEILIANKLYITKAQFKKGDSVFITKKIITKTNQNIDYPFFNVKNVNLYELNFDYYVALNSPTRSSYVIHNINTKLNKRLRRFSIDEVIENTKKTADSLLKRNLITYEFYKKENFELLFFKKNMKIKNSLKTKQKNIEFNLEKIDDIENITPNSNYINYLISKVKYDHFFNEGIRVKNSEVLKYLIINKPFEYNDKLEYLIYDNLLSNIYNQEKENLDKILKKLENDNQIKLVNKYKNITTNENKDLELMRKLSSLKEKILEFNSNDNIQSAMSFDKMLEREKGKLVLIDYWASWCAPCRKEMPSLRKIKKEIDSTRFSVISISIDDKISLWKKAAKQENLTEKSFLLLDHKNSEIIKKYKITTIPRYMLFDKNGVLISDNVMKPSDEKFKEFILKSLNN